MPQMPELNTTMTDEQKRDMNIISLNTAVNELQEEVRVLTKKVLVGNGELPLVEQVRNHETFIKDVRFWVRFIGSSLVLQTLAFGVGTAVAVIKFLPVLEKLANQP